MLFSSRNYAIGMAHYRVAGGGVTLIVIGAACVAVVATIVGLVVYNTDSHQLPTAMRGLATAFLIIETFVLLLFGSARIAACIRSDIATRMMESHRQMPISAWRAMLGYLLGTNLHVLLVALVAVVVLAGLGAWGGALPTTLVMGQIALAFFAAFAWTFAGKGALMFRQAAALMVLGVVFGILAGVFMRTYAILPGLSLLAAPFLGETIFSLVRGVGAAAELYPMALTAQAALSALFFMGACRRYRGSYLTTFNVPMGIALTAIWGLLSAGGMAFGRNVLAMRLPWNHPDPWLQTVAALGVSALLMLVPIYALDVWASRHELKVYQTLLGMAAIVLAGMTVVVAMPQGLYEGRWFLTLLVLAAHAATALGVCRALRELELMKAGLLAGAALFAIWLMPLLLEIVRWFFLPENRYVMERHDMTWISTLSPLGLLLATWTDAADAPGWVAGMVVQGFIAAAVWFVALRRSRTLAARQAAEMA